MWLSFDHHGNDPGNDPGIMASVGWCFGVLITNLPVRVSEGYDSGIAYYCLDNGHAGDSRSGYTILTFSFFFVTDCCSALLKLCVPRPSLAVARVPKW